MKKLITGTKEGMERDSLLLYEELEEEFKLTHGVECLIPPCCEQT